MTDSTSPLATALGDGVQRRTIVAGAAWTIPVIATSVGAPLAAASATAPTEVDLVVSRSCNVVNLFGNLPTFTVSSSTGTVPAGTVLTLTGGALGNIDLRTDGLSIGVLSGSTRTYTVTTAMPTVRIEFVGILSAFAAQNFTLSVTSVPDGYVDSNPGNNSASVNLTGLRVGIPPFSFGFTGICI